MKSAKEILLNVTTYETRAALIDNNMLVEVHIERASRQSVLGNIYKGRVLRVLPGIQAAFVDLGFGREGFLHFKDALQPDALCQGQELLVQISKEPLGAKSARLTMRLSIPSCYLVLTPLEGEIGFSQKITDEQERERLGSSIKLSKEEGFIFRTAAEGISSTDILADQQWLQTTWQKIKILAMSAKAGERVYTEPTLALRVLREWGNDVSRIRVDNENTVKEMKAFTEQYLPRLSECIEYDASGRPIFDIYSVETELKKALQRKVPLKSGGAIVFDQTEAMTTIDVNTGSFHGTKNADDTILQTNIEAIAVITHQLRLRNLGGIIIIDFIDMDVPEHRTRILELLKTALTKDSVRTEISAMSGLGLVQLTRKRVRESLEQILCVPCPLCQCRGSIKSVRTAAYDMLREIKRLAVLHLWPGFLVAASQPVVDYLNNEETHLISDLQRELGKAINIRVENTFSQEKYEVRAE